MNSKYEEEKERVESHTNVIMNASSNTPLYTKIFKEAKKKNVSIPFEIM